ncbi:Recombinase NinB [uncultured Caudovirales phage]|uniref:Recombinase NinB n=1 Tax=uncultured Caudovirales phage TaxID=2100421 RepID=A0A6J5L1T7_9CAUD|nr:Recombinase NinB [uncultured Caudovirales phage]
MRVELNKDNATAVMGNLWPKVKEALASGKQLTLEIKNASRSCPQNSKYHAMIEEIAQQASHLGAKWDAENWKRLLLNEFAKQTNLPQGRIVPSLDGSSIVQLGLQSRKLTKEQASEFVEFLFAWGAANGITYSQV